MAYQVGRKFILLRAETGAILCVDQHAADERVKLENLEKQASSVTPGGFWDGYPLLRESVANEFNRLVGLRQ